jgi:hypothetical protein
MSAVERAAEGLWSDGAVHGTACGRAATSAPRFHDQPAILWDAVDSCRTARPGLTWADGRPSPIHSTYHHSLVHTILTTQEKTP